MNSEVNIKILLAARPQGFPEESDFEIVESEIPKVGEGHILVKTEYLSLDPYMRGRMNDVKSYAPSVEIGDVMVGESVGVVVESQSDKFKLGDYVCVHGGWQSYVAVHGDGPELFQADPDMAPLSTFIGTIGMPGRTAYFGLTRLGKPKEGETVVVSAASGAVGTVVGQMAKILGCRAVGVAGGEEKCSYVTDDLGFDACVDYKAGNLDEDLKNACPNGIDVYFENVGGEVTRAVAKLLNSGSRVPICGFISKYNSRDIMNEETPFDVFGAMKPLPKHRFFVVTEWFDDWANATKELAGWIKEGKINYRETVTDGLENAPQALRDVLSGQNFGKQLVKVADE